MLTEHERKGLEHLAAKRRWILGYWVAGFPVFLTASRLPERYGGWMAGGWFVGWMGMIVWRLFDQCPRCLESFGGPHTEIQFRFIRRLDECAHCGLSLRDGDDDPGR